MKFFIVTLFLILSPFKLSAGDFQLKGEQLQIFQRALGSQVNERMHKKFWSLVPKIQREDILRNKKQFDKFINDNFLLAYKFQQEVWKSIKVSYQQRQVFKTQLYNEYKAILKTKPYSKTAIKNSEGLLHSSAKRVGYKSQRGTVYPTDQMANSVLKNLDQMFYRVSKLVNPIWK